MFSLYFDYLFFLAISCFGFEGGMGILIAPVPRHCILFTSINIQISAETLSIPVLFV